MVFFRQTSSPPSPALPSQTLQVYLQNRPQTTLTPTTFAQRYAPLPSPTSFSTPHALVKVLYLSCDPAMRVWLNPTRSYLPPVKEGAVMRAMGIGQVIRPAGKFRVGDFVEGMFGWNQYVYSDASKLVSVTRVVRSLPLSAALGVLGITGMTAYFGLLDVGKLKRGDCVVVSAAAGATGSVVCQIAKNIYGCFVVGIAGGAAKCRYLEEELGVVAVDYKSEQGVKGGMKNALEKRRIDVYFDNVGGEILESALRYINFGARIVVCGAISGYNKEKLMPGPYNYLNLISYSASMTGFLLRDYEQRFGEARAKLGNWVEDGKILFREDVVVGLENAPKALKRLFDGQNIGKVVVKVAEPIEDGKTLSKL